jgi:heme/copper-type cytochrome/quinol oxidase subunit 4
MDLRYNWNWATGCLSSFLIMFVVILTMVFGLLWGMLLVPLMISGIIFGQNALFFVVGRFAQKHQHLNLKNGVIGLWMMSSITIAGFFLMVSKSGNTEFNWWFVLSLLLIGIEYTLFLLANFIADHPQS